MGGWWGRRDENAARPVLRAVLVDSEDACWWRDGCARNNRARTHLRAGACGRQEGRALHKVGSVCVCVWFHTCCTRVRGVVASPACANANGLCCGRVVVHMRNGLCCGRVVVHMPCVVCGAPRHNGARPGSCTTVRVPNVTARACMSTPVVPAVVTRVGVVPLSCRHTSPPAGLHACCMLRAYT